MPHQVVSNIDQAEVPPKNAEIPRKSRSGIFLPLLLTCIAATPANGVEPTLEIELQGEIVADNPDAQLTVPDLVAVLSEVPQSDAVRLLDRPEQLERLIENVLLSRAIAIDAIESGLLEDSIAESKAYQAAIEAIAREQLSRVRAENELKDYSQAAYEDYLAHPERYERPEVVDFTLLALEGARQEREVRTKLDAIKEQLASGESFSKMVLQFSEHPALDENDGIYKDVSADSLDGRFLSVINGLSIGEVSEPIEIDGDTLLVQLDDRSETTIPDFEEIRGSTIQQVREEHLRNVEERYINQFLRDNTVLRENAFRRVRQFIADRP